MKIEFYSNIIGVSDAYPIVPASEYRPAWMAGVRDDYKQFLKTAVGKQPHIYQCPGIFDLVKTGFVVPMWHDVVIQAEGIDSFRWTVPTAEFIDVAHNAGSDPISSQKTGVGTLMPVKPGVHKALLKINTPWRIVAPKGIKFIMIPYPYPDTFEFESSIGIWEPGVSNELNVQAYWNAQVGQPVTIKAGTPIAQLIPITEKQYDYEVRDATNHDYNWNRKLMYMGISTFKANRAKIKQMYYKHFGSK